MKADSRSRAHPEVGTSEVSVARVVLIGLFGSLAGTAVMDLVMVAEFSMAGLPAETYLALIGSILGGGVSLGVVLHILTGSALGMAFSVALLRFGVLPIETFKKGWDWAPWQA